MGPFREVDAYKTGRGECKMRQEQCVVSNGVLKIGWGPKGSRASWVGSWNGNSVCGRIGKIQIQVWEFFL